MNSEKAQQSIARLYVERNRLYETLPSARLVLEVGAGSGSFSRNWSHPEALILHVDRDESIAGYPAYGVAHKGFRGFAALKPDGRGVHLAGEALEVLPRLPSKTFDLIVMGQLIEHLGVRDLELLLHEAHRLLRPGGMLQVDTVTEKLEESTEGHEQHFTAESLERLLVRLAFTSIEVKEFADGTALWATAKRT